VNLIVNPGADLSAGAPNFSATAVPAGWVTTSNFSAVQYAAGGASDLNTADSVAIGGGVNYFAGGPNTALSTASQNIAFDDLAASVDAGILSFVFSGYLGGFDTQGDNMSVRATFLNASSATLLTATLGPVSDTDRANLSQLLFRTTGAAVPVGARSVDILLTATRLEGAYNDGYADNLSLVFQEGSTPVPEPNSISLLGFGLLGVAGLARVVVKQARQSTRSRD
jgi:hypothetical protein